MCGFLLLFFSEPKLDHKEKLEVCKWGFFTFFPFINTNCNKQICLAGRVSNRFKYSAIHPNIYLGIILSWLSLGSYSVDVSEPVVDCLAKKTNRTFHKYTIICFPCKREMAAIAMERVDSKVLLTTLNPNFCWTAKQKWQLLGIEIVVEPMTFQNRSPLLHRLSYQSRWEWAVGIEDHLLHHMIRKRWNGAKLGCVALEVNYGVKCNATLSYCFLFIWPGLYVSYLKT